MKAQRNAVTTPSPANAPQAPATPPLRSGLMLEAAGYTTKEIAARSRQGLRVAAAKTKSIMGAARAKVRPSALVLASAGTVVGCINSTSKGIDIPAPPPNTPDPFGPYRTQGQNTSNSVFIDLVFGGSEFQATGVFLGINPAGQGVVATAAHNFVGPLGQASVLAVGSGPNFIDNRGAVITDIVGAFPHPLYDPADSKRFSDSGIILLEYGFNGVPNVELAESITVGARANAAGYGVPMIQGSQHGAAGDNHGYFTNVVSDQLIPSDVNAEYYFGTRVNASWSNVEATASAGDSGSGMFIDGKLAGISVAKYPSGLVVNTDVTNPLTGDFFNHYMSIPEPTGAVSIMFGLAGLTLKRKKRAT